MGEGYYNIDAGRQSATIAIDDIPQDRFGFIQGDRKIIVTLSESSNSLLGDNLEHTYTLTDDQKAWTDPSADQFCISDFDNPRSSATIIAKTSSNLDTEVESTQFNRSDESFADTNSEIQNLNTDVARDQAERHSRFRTIEVKHQSLGIRPSDCDSRWRAQGSTWQLVGMD